MEVAIIEKETGKEVARYSINFLQWWACGVNLHS